MEQATPLESVPVQKGWMDRIAKNSVKKDKIEGSDLIGEFVALVLMMAALWFFVAHKLNETGFYTEEFGGMEMFALYSAGAFTVFVAAVRIALRRHNIVRPLETASFVLLSVAHAVLLVRFPFDFDHVADVLPGALEWTVGWISETIGKVILALGIPGGIIAAAITMIIYFGVKKELSAVQEPPPTPSEDDSDA